jgi:2-oxoisovalerate dehydrogenase E2 component (dihydrolipoyl transacylase)
VTGGEDAGSKEVTATPEKSIEASRDAGTAATPAAPQESRPQPPTKSYHQTLATPAVRHLTRELEIDLADVPGTGKDGRVLKEDVHRYAASLRNGNSAETGASPSSATSTTGAAATAAPLPADQPITLSPLQMQMYKTMTRSLQIPHFLYTTTVDFTALTSLRKRLNTNTSTPHPSLSALPFIIKALSLALHEYPQLNTHLHAPDAAADPTAKPTLTRRAAHNIGLAIDSPAGLVVPVIPAAQTLSVREIAARIAELATAARAGRLPPGAFADATITVSNIGSIAAGAAVAPVIVPPQTAILGVGRSRVVPAFGPAGEVVPREECVFSWSADHRVLDGAVVARCAEVVRELLEDVEGMVVRMR